MTDENYSDDTQVVEVKLNSKGNKRGMSEGFLKNKGKIAEIRKNMTPEQLQAMKEKRLKTRIARRYEAPNVEDVKLWVWDELTKPRERGSTSHIMLANLNEFLRNPDYDKISPKEYVRLCMDMLKFVAGASSDKRPSTAVQVNVNNGQNTTSSTPKNVIDIPEYRERIENASVDDFDISQLDSMNTEEIQNFIDGDDDGED